MDVLVTGATGYVGSAVAGALAAAGHRVTGLARSEKAAERLRERGLEARRGDLEDPASVAAAARNAGAVVHAAVSDGPAPGETERAVVEAVFEELRGPGKTFIYTSGGWVMGDTGGEVADEESPVDPPPGMEWRPGVEELVLETAASYGVRAVVVRPALVYGGGGGVIAELVEWARERGVARYVRPPEGECYWTLVHQDDLGGFYARILGKEDGPGGTLVVAAGSEPQRVREIAAAAGRAAGAGPTVEAWPLAEAREELGFYADSLALSQKLSGGRARSLFGFEPAAPTVFEELDAGTYSRGYSGS